MGSECPHNTNSWCKPRLGHWRLNNRLRFKPKDKGKHPLLNLSSPRSRYKTIIHRLPNRSSPQCSLQTVRRPLRPNKQSLRIPERQGASTGTRAGVEGLRPKDPHRDKIKGRLRRRHRWNPIRQMRPLPLGLYQQPLISTTRYRLYSRCLKSTTVPPSIQTVARRPDSRLRPRFVILIVDSQPDELTAYTGSTSSAATATATTGSAIPSAKPHTSEYLLSAVVKESGQRLAFPDLLKLECVMDRCRRRSRLSWLGWVIPYFTLGQPREGCRTGVVLSTVFCRGRSVDIVGVWEPHLRPLHVTYVSDNLTTSVPRCRVSTTILGSRRIGRAHKLE